MPFVNRVAVTEVELDEYPGACVLLLCREDQLEMLGRIVVQKIAGGEARDIVIIREWDAEKRAKGKLPGNCYYVRVEVDKKEEWDYE